MTKPVSESLILKCLRSPWLWPGVAFLVTAGLAGGGYYLSDMWLSDLEQEHRAQKRVLDQAKRRHDSAVEQMEIADNYQLRYKRYLEHQMIGDLDRLRWSDGLQAISTRLELKGVGISFSGKQELDEELKRQLDVRENIYTSYQLEVSFVAQHEGDLFRFFNQIDRHISPMYLVKSCDMITRNREDPRYDYTAAGNLSTRCSLLLLQAEPREID